MQKTSQPSKFRNRFQDQDFKHAQEQFDALSTDDKQIILAKLNKYERL